MIARSPTPDSRIMTLILNSLSPLPLAGPEYRFSAMPGVLVFVNKGQLES